MIATHRKTTTLIATLVSCACAAAMAAGALAATTPQAGGTVAAPGVGAPTTSTTGKALATWFGPGFYGKQTACGQTLTPAVIGVANRTLPCGTLVRIRYADHVLTVPVLDRGPYGTAGAQWDLTAAAAAAALGIEDTVRIRTRVVGRVSNTPTLGTPPGAAGQTLATGGAQAG